MPIPAQFLDMMPNTVSVYPLSTRSNYGEISYSGTATQYRCRVVPSNRLMRTQQGEEKQASTMVWVYGTGINLTDKVVLPDGSTRLIMRVERWVDDVGDHHDKLYLE